MSFRSLRGFLFISVAMSALFAGQNASLARQAHRHGAPSSQDAQGMEPLSHENAREIIFEMEPLRPVKSRSAVAPVKKPVVDEATRPAQEAKAPPKTDAAKTDAAKTDAAKTDAAKTDAAKTDAAKTDAAKTEAKASAEAPNSEQPAAAKPAPMPAANAAAKPAAISAQPAIAPAPSSQPQPVAAPEEAAQPTPLPLDQALAPNGAAPVPAPVPPPAADAANDKPAPAEETKAADSAPASAPAQDAAASQDAPSVQDAAKGQATPAADTPPAMDAPATAASEADAAKRIASLLAEGVKGPAEVRLGDRATMFLPAGRVLLVDEAARKLAQEAGLDLRATTRAVVAPNGDTLRWLAPVEMLDDGYIKTDAALEPEKLLAAFSAGLPEVNLQRAKSGQPGVELQGWLTAPALDANHRLSACVNVVTQGGGDKYFNCEAWTLGRDGALKVSLAEGGEEGAQLKDEARMLAETIVFDRGKTYEEMDLAKDKIAPYAVGDLLTSDVSAKHGAASSTVASPSRSGMSVASMLIMLLRSWKLLLLAAALVVGVRKWLSTRKAKPADQLVRNVSARKDAIAPQQLAPKEDAAPSLFAKLLPSLHAKFSKRPTEAPAPAPKSVDMNEAGLESDMTQGAAPTKPASEGLLGKIAGLRGEAAEPKAASKETPEGPLDLSAALMKLSSRMRGGASDAQSANPVDMSRIQRGTRTLPGGAPEADETRLDSGSIAPRPAVASPPAEPVKERAAAARAPDEVGFGLVEPGDAEATSAAMNASELLRQKSA